MKDDVGERRTSHANGLSQINKLVLRVIDDGAEILGDEPVKRAFYFHVEKISKTKRQEIPSNLIAFHDALVELFGKGATILERRMARMLFEKLGLAFEARDGWTLNDYVKYAKTIV